MKENKKSNVLTVILVLVIVGLVGFILYDKGLLIKKDSVKEKEKVEEKGRSFNPAVAEEILDKFSISCTNVDNYQNNDVIKFGAMMNNLNKAKYMSYSCEDLLSNELGSWDNQEGSDGYYKSTDGVTHFCGKNYFYELYPFEDLKTKYYEMFEGSIEKKNYGSYYYLSDKDGFAELLYADGTAGPTIFIDKVSSANIKDNMLTMIAHMEVIVAEDDTHFKVGKNVFEFNSNDPKTIDAVEKEIIDKHLDDVTKYEIKFKIKDDRYVFNSIKKA